MADRCLRQRLKHGLQALLTLGKTGLAFLDPLRTLPSIQKTLVS